MSTPDSDRQDSDSQEPTIPPDPSDRDAVCALLEDGIQEAHRKVENGRVYDAENEKVRQGWVRALAYAVGQYRQLMKDKDLEEMNERLAALEEQQGIQQ